MAKRFLLAAVALLLIGTVHPAVHAETGSLTIPGSMPTLAPLSLPLNSFTVSPSDTPAPSRAPQKQSTASSSSYLTKILGGAGITVVRFVGQLKLNGTARQMALQVLQNALSFLKAYNARIDPIIRSWLTGVIRKLPDSARHVASLFIPFLTMAGEVILGVVGGIILLKLLLAVLDRFIIGMFRRKRRRR